MNETKISQKYIEDIRDFFFGRTDAYGLWNNDTWVTIKEELTDKILLKHLNKEITIGIYPYYRKNNLWYCKWICIDIDDHNEKDIQKLKEKLDTRTYEIKILIKDYYKIERNNIGREISGRGYHIWIKLKDFTPLERAYKFKRIIEGLLLEVFNISTEINPKQNEIKGNDLGNFVKLPFGINRKSNVECKMLDTFDISAQGVGYEIAEEYIIQKEESKKEIKEKKEDLIKKLPIGKLRKQHQDILNGVIEIEEYAEKVAKELGKNRGEFEFIYWIELFRDAYDKYRYKPQDLYPILVKNQPKFEIKETEKQLKYHDYTKKEPSKRLLSIMKKYYPNYHEKKEKEEIEELSWEIAKQIIAEHNIITLRENKEFCIYKDGVYLRDQETYIEQWVCELLEGLNRSFSTQLYLSVIRIIRSKTYTSIYDFDNNYDLINVKNGLLNIRTIELKEHTPEYLSFIQIPVNYNPELWCPEIARFFQTIFHKDDIPVILKMIGLSLTKDVKYLKAFMFYGVGNNGKTVFFNLLSELYGKNNRSQIDLSELTHKFKGWELENKITNIRSDIKTNRTVDVDFSKIYVGGESTIMVERKYKDRYPIIPTAKLWYACNMVFPEVSDNTDKGYWRKWISIECPKVFDGKEVLDYIEKIQKPSELSGLLNIAIRAYNNLEKDGNLINIPDWEDVKNLWLSKLDLFSEFIEKKGEIGVYEDITINPNNEFWETKETALKMYNKYRKEKGRPPFVTSKRITTKIKAHPDFKLVNRLLDGKRTEVYAGFKITEKSKDSQQQIDDIFADLNID